MAFTLQVYVHVLPGAQLPPAPRMEGLLAPSAVCYHSACCGGILKLAAEDGLLNR